MTPTPRKSEEEEEADDEKEAVRVSWQEAVVHTDKLLHSVEHSNHYNTAQVLNMHT